MTQRKQLFTARVAHRIVRRSNGPFVDGFDSCFGFLYAANCKTTIASAVA